MLNTDPAVRLDAQFGPTQAVPGREGFLSQSGALGLAIIDQANVLGLGLSSFVSIGNKADLSGNAPLVFVSYSRDDRDVCLKLDAMLRPVLDSGRVELWLDDRLNAGDVEAEVFDRILSADQGEILDPQRIGQ